MTKDPQYFRPRNWSKFQTNSNNTLPWIKNYTALLTDPDYTELTDTQRGVLHGLWLLYGIRRRALEWSTRYLGRALNIPSQNLGRTLGVLERRNFIELCDATFTEERRGDKRREEKKPPISPLQGDLKVFDEFWNLYPRQRRGSKQKSLTAWKQALLRSSDGEILAGLRDYIGSDEVKRGFAKGAAAWLNDDRWKSDYRTFRKKTPDEQLQEWVDGDEGNDIGSGEIDGECLDISGQRPESNGGDVSHCIEGDVGRPGEVSGNGTVERMAEEHSAKARRHPDSREGAKAALQDLAAIAAKKAKP